MEFNWSAQFQSPQLAISKRREEENLDTARKFNKELCSTEKKKPNVAATLTTLFDGVKQGVAA